MRLIVLLSVLGVVLCAPVPDDQAASSDDKAAEHKVSKRSDEKIVYGNQQNFAKVKKSDPSLDALGKVHANEAKALKEITKLAENEVEASEKSNEPANIEEELNEVVHEVQDQNKAVEENKEEVNTPVIDTSKATEDDKDSEQTETESPSGESTEVVNQMSPEEAISIDQLENMAAGRPDEDDNSASTEETGSEMEADLDPNSGLQLTNTDDESSEEKNYETEEMYEFQRLLDRYPEYLNYLIGDSVAGRRKRDAARRMIISRLRNKRRSRRTKRDLPYDDDLYLPVEYYPEPAMDEESYLPYVPSGYYEPEQEEYDNDPYVKLLNEIADEEPETMYEDKRSPVSGMEPVIYDGQIGYFVPQKRGRGMLSFVPGNKRDNYFYPFSPEPETHYKAFVSQKRNYEDTYSRLVRLARALAMQPEERYGW